MPWIPPPHGRAFPGSTNFVGTNAQAHLLVMNLSDHFGDQEMLLVLLFQGNNVLQRTLRGFVRYAFLALSYQYQMRAVEDLVADCASIASVHTLFLDLSRLGKPSEHMTVGM